MRRIVTLTCLMSLLSISDPAFAQTAPSDPHAPPTTASPAYLPRRATLFPSGTRVLPPAVRPPTPSTIEQPQADEAVDSRGDLTLTLLGGLGGVAAAGGVFGVVFALAEASHTDEDTSVDEGSWNVTPADTGAFWAILAAPLLIGAGVSLAGDATGGTGTYAATFLGFAGLLPGILLLSVEETPVLLGLGVALLPIGYIVGAVIGYRWSADDPPTTPSASVALVPLREGAMLAVSGGF